MNRSASLVSRGYYSAYKTLSRSTITNRVAHFAPLCNVSYNRLVIRNQRRRWGSCSTKGNLNFNYKLLFLEPDLLDYIIVHELCHLKQFNHGPKFWFEVAQVIPDYKEKIIRLRQLELETKLCPAALLALATHLPSETRELVGKVRKLPRTRPKTKKRKLPLNKMIYAILGKIKL